MFRERIDQKPKRFPLIATNSWIILAARRSVNYFFAPNSRIFRKSSVEKKGSGNSKAFCFTSKRKILRSYRFWKLSCPKICTVIMECVKKECPYFVQVWWNVFICRGRSRTPALSKTEPFAIIVESFKYSHKELHLRCGRALSSVRLFLFYF